jgi:probable F420-dependent oxidoreductase
MKYGTGFALTKMGVPTSEIVDFTQALEGAGINYMTFAGHALSAAPDRYAGRPPATFVGPFRDPFVTFAYLAAKTSSIHFFTGILIAASMPTALLAKQAAELQNVSNGRFEMGVGISWNEDEYKALGQPFANRARRQEEQAVLMKKFWTEKYVTFESRYHSVNALGIGTLPSPPPPIWYGSNMVDRVARVADGWMPIGDVVAGIPALRDALKANGRDATNFPIMGRLPATDDGPEAWVAEARRLQSAGVTHLTIGMPPGVDDLTATIKRVAEAKNAVEAALGV